MAQEFAQDLGSGGTTPGMTFNTETYNSGTGDYYVTEYSHTSSSGKTYDNVQMIVDPKTGATISGNLHLGYTVCIPDENGKVSMFKVDTDHGANVETAAVSDIRDLAYLINSDVESSHDIWSGNYGDNKELERLTHYEGDANSRNTRLVNTYGEMGTINIDGKDVPIALPNTEKNLDRNFLSSIDLEQNNKLSTESKGTEEQEKTNVSGGKIGETVTKDEALSTPEAKKYIDNDSVFMKGLNGQAESDFPWIDVAYADNIEKFAGEQMFQNNMTFQNFTDTIDSIINTANEQINILMCEHGEGKKAIRAEYLRTAQSLVSDFSSAKAALNKEACRQAIVTYNDNVEQAKVEDTRKALRAACEDYNQNNENVVERYESEYDNERRRHHTETRRHTTRNPDGTSETTTTYMIYVFDKIEYDGLIAGDWFGSLFNMKNDRMVQELEQRNIHISIEDRPDWTK